MKTKKGTCKETKKYWRSRKKTIWYKFKIIRSISYFSQLSTQAKELFHKIKKGKNDIDPEKFICVKNDRTIFNFNKFKNSLDLASNIYRDKNLLKDSENKQHYIKILSNKLRNYSPTNPKKIKNKKETLIAAEKLLNNRQEVIDAFKTGIFPYIDGFQIKEESEKEKLEKIKNDFKKFIKYIENESISINYDLFKHYLNFAVPGALAKRLYETKNKEKNNKLVKEIKNRWSDLKHEVEKMSEDEKEIEQPDKVLKIVENILEFNRQQQGQVLKTLTPNWMLSRLPISLA